MPEHVQKSLTGNNLSSHAKDAAGPQASCVPNKRQPCTQRAAPAWARSLFRLCARLVLGHVRGEADGGGAAPACVQPARRQLVDVGQQLRLGHARVAHQQHVDLPAHAPARVRLRASPVARALGFLGFGVCDLPRAHVPGLPTVRRRAPLLPQAAPTDPNHCLSPCNGSHAQPCMQLAWHGLAALIPAVVTMCQGRGVGSRRAGGRGGSQADL